jgi:hypothetical protein
MELWVAGQSDVYTLEAKTKKAKEDFAAELRKQSKRRHFPSLLLPSLLSICTLHNFNVRFR